MTAPIRPDIRARFNKVVQAAIEKVDREIEKNNQVEVAPDPVTDTAKSRANKRWERNRKLKALTIRPKRITRSSIVRPHKPQDKDTLE